MDLFSAQIRAARELVGCSQAVLAKKAGIARDTLVQVEAGRDVTDRTRKAILAALSSEGVELIVDTERGRYGVVITVNR
jgi:DNA-binding XRE family transcriptional regulator